MSIDLQFKIKSNPNFLRYLRNNSFWYKYLNRDETLFNRFADEAKETYRLRPSDKFNDAIEKIQLVQSFLSVLNK